MLYLRKPDVNSDILFCVVDSDADTFTGLWMTLGIKPPCLLAGGKGGTAARETFTKKELATWERFDSVEEAQKAREYERKQQQD